jgi:hypothetical protein
MHDVIKIGRRQATDVLALFTRRTGTLRHRSRTKTELQRCHFAPVCVFPPIEISVRFALWKTRARFQARYLAHVLRVRAGCWEVRLSNYEKTVQWRASAPRRVCCFRPHDAGGICQSHQGGRFRHAGSDPLTLTLCPNPNPP